MSIPRPYDWTREPEPDHTPQRRDPTRIIVSALVAGTVAVLASFLALVAYVLGIAVMGLDETLPAGLGVFIGLGFGIAVAMITWRGIRLRWTR